MTTETEIIARAKEILSGKSTFVTDDSQFIDDISTMLGVGVNKAVHESHSDRNEFFSETAQLDSSLLAKASDEGRIPNRPIPQIVNCEITTASQQTFNGDSVFVSEIGTKYLYDGSIVVDNETVQIDLRQEEKNSYTYQPTAEEWQEFVVGGKKTSRFLAYVDSILWEDFEAIGDLGEESEGYVTRYNTLEQLYIRTGNGFLGKIPVGQIDIVSYDTEAQDIQVDAPLYAEGLNESVEIKVLSIVQTSQAQESAQSVAKSLPFWRLEAGGSGYGSDYIGSVSKEFPEALSVRAWGERRESAVYNRDNINVIFISALREENQETLGSEVLAFINAKKHLLQVEFEWKEPILIASSLTIIGKIEKTKSKSDSEESLKTAISKYFALYAEKEYRKEKIYKSFLGSIVRSTSVFENLLPYKPRNEEPAYEISITGSQIPSGKREIIYIPEGNITVNIAHVSNA